MRRRLRQLRATLERPINWLLANIGLRWRITIAFAVGALVLSMVLAGIAYGLTRENLLDQRQSNLRTLAVTNARTVWQTLSTSAEGGDDGTDDAGGEPGAPPGVFSGMSVAARSPETTLLVFRENGWSATGNFQRQDLPPSLVEAVTEQRQPARMRFATDGTTYLAMGLPMEGLEGEPSASYFEVVPLTDVQDALESLTIGLLAAGSFTTIAGALFGMLAAHRVLRPLDSIRRAAERLANGDLTTRVDAGNDPDLVVLAESFNDMVNNLQRRIEQDTRFASNVTHELRSPLTTIQASVDVLENTRDELPDRAQTAVDLLVADLNRFTQLIQDLLEMSRLDAGVTNVEPDSVLIAELVMFAVDQQSDRDIPVDVSGELAGVIVQVDKRRLLRVIANLLDNAAKYAGGAERVEIMLVDDMVQVAVEDNGPGVAERDRQRIFDRFSRGWVEGERAGRKGVGLGLSIVAEHVRIHGGEAWVESRTDGQPGARFVFTLPVDTATQPKEFGLEEDLSVPPDEPDASDAAPAMEEALDT